MERNGTMQVDFASFPSNSTKGRIPPLNFARSKRKNERKELVRVLFNRCIALLRCSSRMWKITFVELGALCLVRLGLSSCGGEKMSLAGNLSPAEFISDDYVTV